MSEKEKSTVAKEKLKRLLSITKRIVNHHHEMSVAKGEHFNLFSVLGIENKENKTHSAFLTELLNPKGSHLMGDVFLKQFLIIVNKAFSNEDTQDSDGNELFKLFNTCDVFVKAEQDIGKNNYNTKTGGRIDIYLEDKKGNTICIENKIYASDQKAQIERYCNFKKETNKVFYLTLKGNHPSKESKGELVEGEDFFNISYRENIVQWLELCLKEVPNFTSLREAINQYILLIKKLTNTMNKEQEKELLEIMMANIEESKFIAHNYDMALIKLRGNFRENLMEVLKEKLNSENYDIVPGSPIKNKFSQIWIQLKCAPQSQFLFGVESFSGSGHKNGDMFVGLLDKRKSPVIKTIEVENRLNEMWKHVRFIKTEDNNTINLAHNYTIKILNDKTSLAYQTLLNTCCDQIVSFVKDYEKKLRKELIKSNLTRVE